MKKYICILLLLPLLAISCSDDDNHHYVVMKDGPVFNVLDVDGNDLLDPDTENAIDTSKIKIYYLVDDQKIEFSVYHNQQGYILDDQRGFSVIKPISESDDAKYIIGISFGMAPHNKEGIAYTYVEWNEHDTDTIKSVYEEFGATIFTYMVQYNDIPWTKEQYQENFIIIK